MNQKELEQNRQWVQGKFIIGIDLAKEKHTPATAERAGWVI